MNNSKISSLYKANTVKHFGRKISVKHNLYNIYFQKCLINHPPPPACQINYLF